MFGMQKIHRKTCKNCYIIPVPTTIEYGNFRNHSSLNFTLFPLHLILSFESPKYIEKVWEIKDSEKLPFLQAIYLQCTMQIVGMYQNIGQRFFTNVIELQIFGYSKMAYQTAKLVSCLFERSMETVRSPKTHFLALCLGLSKDY